MKVILVEFAGYGLASVFALAADMGVLIFLTRMHMNYLPASALSFTLGAVVAYLLSVRFVFKTRRIQGRALEFGSFMTLGLVGLVVNSLVMRIAVGSLGATVVMAKGAAACCTFGTNFALRRQLLFKARGALP